MSVCEMSTASCQPVNHPVVVKSTADSSLNDAPDFDSSRKGRFNLTFDQLEYKVRDGVGLRFKRDWKCILKGISGEFLSGELTGIIGPSGSGKSTLMDILAGYTIPGRKGTVMFNGEREGLTRRDVCYIMQNSQLQPLLKVVEALNFAANLRLSSDVTCKEKKDMINRILESLCLTKCIDTYTVNLSDGQKKRLAIGLELLTNPPVMLFDEPTSGLDCCSAKQCLEIMKSIATDNRIVVCSIHQPSALLLKMFDHLYALAEGECIYQGSVTNLTSYLSTLGFICPPYHNPADFVLELAFEDDSSTPNRQKLVNGSGNGRFQKWRSHVSNKDESSQNQRTYSTSRKYNECNINDHSTLMKYDIIHPSQCSKTFCKQTIVLLHRTIIRLYREKHFMWMRLFLHVLVGFGIGLFYQGIGNDAAYVFDNFSLIFFCLMFLMFTAFSAMIMAFPSELPIIAREYFNCWYSLRSYYFAVVIADVIFQTLCTFIYCVFVYFFSLQPRDVHRFILFTMMYVLVTLVSQGMGLLVGASMDIKHGMVFGPLFISPWVIFSGFFLHLNDAAPFFHWIFHISFLKHGLEGVMDAVYGNNRTRLPCSEVYCHFVSPKKLLKELDLLHNDYWTNFYILCSYVIILYTITYFMLKYQVSRRR